MPAFRVFMQGTQERRPSLQLEWTKTLNSNIMEGAVATVLQVMLSKLPIEITVHRRMQKIIQSER